MINVCKSENSGSEDDLVIELENTNGEICRTDNLRQLTRGTMVTFSLGKFDKSGTKCKNFEVTPVTYAKVYNSGGDDLCITDLQLDVRAKNGKQKIKSCYLDMENKYQPIHVDGIDNLPLVCK